jgi:hypothetical protein
MRCFELAVLLCMPTVQPIVESFSVVGINSTVTFGLQVRMPPTHEHSPNHIKTGDESIHYLVHTWST